MNKNVFKIKLNQLKKIIKLRKKSIYTKGMKYYEKLTRIELRFKLTLMLDDPTKWVIYKSEKIFGLI